VITGLKRRDRVPHGADEHDRQGDDNRDGDELGDRRQANRFDFNIHARTSGNDNTTPPGQAPVALSKQLT
jgi:hypothetical protein